MTDFFLLKAFITEKYFSFFLEDNIQTSVVCKRLAPGYACARKWRMTQETGDITDRVEHLYFYNGHTLRTVGFFFRNGAICLLHEKSMIFSKYDARIRTDIRGNFVFDSSTTTKEHVIFSNQ